MLANLVMCALAFAGPQLARPSRSAVQMLDKKIIKIDAGGEFQSREASVQVSRAAARPAGARLGELHTLAPAPTRAHAPVHAPARPLPPRRGAV
jgi:hypothetical protein